MIDTYLKSKNRESLAELGTALFNVIGPMKGRAAFTHEGVEYEAAGDPEYWYTCVRAPFPVPAFGDVLSCTEAEGKAVCGVWA